MYFLRWQLELDFFSSFTNKPDGIHWWGIRSTIFRGYLGPSLLGTYDTQEKLQKTDHPFLSISK